MDEQEEISIKVALQTLQKDVSTLTETVDCLAESVSKLQLNITGYKGVLGGVGLTLSCFWAFFSLFWDKIKAGIHV